MTATVILLKHLWISLAALSLVFASTVAQSSDYTITPQAAKSPVHGQIWAGYALLKHIASCESWGDPNKEPREFLPDGSVLRGYPNPNDVGLAQINIPTWGATATKLGFDLYSYDGNLAMAKWIFDHDGSSPWKYSEGCWGKYALDAR